MISEADMDALDKLSAIHVMGWVWEPDPVSHHGGSWLKPGVNGARESWGPTRNISDAWELLEKTEHLFALGKVFADGISKPLYIVEMYGRYGGERNPRLCEKCSTAPLAITIAALRVKGVNFE